VRPQTGLRAVLSWAAGRDRKGEHERTASACAVYKLGGQISVPERSLKPAWTVFAALGTGAPRFSVGIANLSRHDMHLIWRKKCM